MPFVGVMTTQKIVNLVVTSDMNNYNLYVEAGSPAGPVTVNLTIDAATVDNFLVNSFFASAILNVTCINGGVISGAGGDGSGILGAAGAGTDALTTYLDVNLNIDDGFLYGGGGGGGSGTSGLFTYAGGGGAGQPVGAAGFGTIVVGQNAEPGTATIGGPGTDGPPNGGAGGDVGNAGVTSTNPGGAAGNATTSLGGAVVTLSGVKSEAALITENRIEGTLA